MVASKMVNRRNQLLDNGFMRIELIAAITILCILATMALPWARNEVIRKIPIDPMTRTADWGVRAMQDDPDSKGSGGQNVFDVHSKSQGTALDGTPYGDW
jgi:hypothetical protein